jgi:hypothetical protein
VWLERTGVAGPIFLIALGRMPVDGQRSVMYRARSGESEKGVEGRRVSLVECGHP